MDQAVKTTSIQGLLEIARPTFSDDRGFFRESARISEIEDALSVSFDVKQMNHARSSKKILRGIHAAPWNKLVYVTRGRVQAVIVDLRPDSSTFGKHESFDIGDNNRSSLFIPKGCGNSYLVLSDEADYTYLTDQEWEPDKEFGILWSDTDLKINWKLEGEPIISDKDKQNPTIRDKFPDKF